MIIKIVLNFFIGLTAGLILEIVYRSINAKKLVIPKFVNFQMYGLTGAFLFWLYYLSIPITIKLILIFIFPTLVELITGYLYLIIKGVYLWDYSKQQFNFKKLICLRFSIYWFIIALVYYYLLGI
jgi:uncharacterized protein